MEILSAGSSRELESNQWRLVLSQSSQTLRFSLVVDGHRSDVFDNSVEASPDWLSAESGTSEVIFDLTRLGSIGRVSFEIAAIADGVLAWSLESLNSNDVFSAAGQEVGSGEAGAFLVLTSEGGSWFVEPHLIASSLKGKTADNKQRGRSVTRPIEVLVDATAKTQEMMGCPVFGRLLKQLGERAAAIGVEGLIVNFGGVVPVRFDEPAQTGRKLSDAIAELAKVRATPVTARILALNCAAEAKSGSQIVLLTDRPFLLLDALVNTLSEKDLLLTVILVERGANLGTMAPAERVSTVSVSCEGSETEVQALVDSL